MDAIERVVQRVAYRIYQQRIRIGRCGNDKQDWFEAEKELNLNTKGEQK